METLLASVARLQDDGSRAMLQPVSVRCGDVTAHVPAWVCGVLLAIPAVYALAICVRAVGYVWNVFNAPLVYTWHPPENNGKRYNLDEMPTPYPNTWYYLARDADLVQGVITEVQLAGKTLVATRLKDGRAVAADALCPHLGANFSTGGHIDLTSSCITCPFHSWSFSLEDGHLVRIPYANPPDAKLPSFVKLKTYPVEQVTGCVFVWIDAEGRTGREIPFRPFDSSQWQGGTDGGRDKPPVTGDGEGDKPPVPEQSGTDGERDKAAPPAQKCDPPTKTPSILPTFLTTPRYHGQTTHLIRTHILEIPENGADLFHFPVLHTQLAFAPLDSLISRTLTHDFSATYNVAPTSPATYLTVTHQFTVGGWKVGGVMRTRVEQCGPAIAVLRIDFFGLGEVVIIETPIPIAPFLCKVYHTCYAPSWLPRFVIKALFFGMVRQYERDAVVWNKKGFVANPPFPKEEAPLVGYRRWFKQFVSPNSISARRAVEEHVAGTIGAVAGRGIVGGAAAGSAGGGGGKCAGAGVYDW